MFVYKYVFLFIFFYGEFVGYREVVLCIEFFMELELSFCGILIFGFFFVVMIFCRSRYIWFDFFVLFVRFVWFDVEIFKRLKELEELKVKEMDKM